MSLQPEKVLRYDELWRDNQSHIGKLETNTRKRPRADSTTSPHRAVVLRKRQAGVAHHQELRLDDVVAPQFVSQRDLWREGRRRPHQERFTLGDAKHELVGPRQIELVRGHKRKRAVHGGARRRNPLCGRIGSNLGESRERKRNSCNGGRHCDAKRNRNHCCQSTAIHFALTPARAS